MRKLDALLKQVSELSEKVDAREALLEAKGHDATCHTPKKIPKKKKVAISPSSAAEQLISEVYEASGGTTCRTPARGQAHVAGSDAPMPSPADICENAEASLTLLEDATAEVDAEWEDVCAPRKAVLYIGGLSREVTEEKLKTVIVKKSKKEIKIYSCYVTGPSKGYTTSYARITVDAKSANVLLARSFWQGRAHCRKWRFAKSGDKEDAPGSPNTEGADCLTGEDQPGTSGTTNTAQYESGSDDTAAHQDEKPHQ